MPRKRSDKRLKPWLRPGFFVSAFDIADDEYQYVPIIGIEGAMMAKNTSVTLGDHFDGFVAEQVQSGRYGSVSEVIRAGLRKLEDDEQKLETLRRLISEGKDSGVAQYSYSQLMQEMDD